MEARDCRSLPEISNQTALVRVDAVDEQCLTRVRLESTVIFETDEVDLPREGRVRGPEGLTVHRTMSGVNLIEARVVIGSANVVKYVVVQGAGASGASISRIVKGLT